jgi:heat-inducible transcriptional repressor
MKDQQGHIALPPRSLDVLDAVVRLNIETGRPVSSGLVERYLLRKFSSATIRSVMKALEDEGYLEQPHPSAGRLPTDAGFRVFVDRLQSSWSLQRHEVPAGLRQMAAGGSIRQAGGNERLKAMAALLSRLTDNISIIVGPTLASVRTVRVECYPRSLRRVLMVVVLENAQVRTGLVDLPAETPATVVAEAGRLISDRVAGLTVGEIGRGVLESLDLVSTPVTRCAAAMVRRGQALFAATEEGDIELEGVSKVLEEPEFHDPEPLKALIRFIESPALIRRTLDRLNDRDPEGFRVWIGEENPFEPLRRFSILTGRIDFEGRPGMLAVLGPRRMSYTRAFHGVDILRQVIIEDSGTLAN